MPQQSISQLAIVVGPEKTQHSLKSISIPEQEDDEILVRVLATAQNPSDCTSVYLTLSFFWSWRLIVLVDAGKVVEFGLSDVGMVPGCDFAGVVEEVGKGVTKVKKGDRVRASRCQCTLRLAAR